MRKGWKNIPKWELFDVQYIEIVFGRQIYLWCQLRKKVFVLNRQSDYFFQAINNFLKYIFKFRINKWHKIDITLKFLLILHDLHCQNEKTKQMNAWWRNMKYFFSIFIKIKLISADSFYFSYPHQAKKFPHEVCIKKNSEIYNLEDKIKSCRFQHKIDWDITIECFVISYLVLEKILFIEPPRTNCLGIFFLKKKEPGNFFVFLEVIRR